ncbi:M-phase inducer phosphatase-like isoform X2 [Macrosteles quadrilineatus]|uniref:M-phase inducer phosphatase-like isoform X2 n=1 Tax=Macrosteles quadrilineatus TaxID=74068 RepID=UPI0023E0B041|nr:M-phase inducer phosphatase-like isoform X2 [Macrosteles quadrilineatus]
MLLKQSLKFNSPSTPVAPVRRTSVVRRLGSLSDENYNPMLSSPEKTFVSPSKFQAVRQLSSGRIRQPLEDQDPNSQDSGYCHSEDSKSVSSDFTFALPSGLAPRRSTTESPRSRTSSESVDDGFLDFSSPLQDEEAQLPAGLGGLIKDPIINYGLSADSAHFQNFRQIISENIPGLSPIVEEKAKKRVSNTPLDITPISKRYKANSEHATPPRTKQHTLFQFGFKRLSEPRPLLSHSLSLEEPITPPPRPKFRHCLSESEAAIKSALHRSQEEELIGDFSKRFALPLIPGSHQDLKSISPSTLARLINGEFGDTIASFQIIDCRYPYEFEGGHIRGARNMYTKDQVMKEFLEERKGEPPSTTTADGKRHIIVFHCEFSSERGPGLSRFLRSKDRESNAYPALHHPELYLLEGGYKAFYHTFPALCEPQAYRKMVDADKEQLQHFRAKSKTWSGDRSSRTLKRSTSFKRLGL